MGIIRNGGQTSPIVLRNVRFEVLERIVDFVYAGTVDCKDTSEEEDIRDGLHILRMTEYLGVISKSSDLSIGQVEGEFGESVSLINDCKINEEENNNRKNSSLLNDEMGSDWNSCVEDTLVGNPSEPSKMHLDEKFDDQRSIKVRSDNNLVTCPVCGKSLKNEKSLRAHTNRKHFNSRKTFVGHKCEELKKPTGRYACEICGQAYHKKESLKSHMYKKHPERRSECESCGKKFMSRIASINHIQICEERQSGSFKCFICDKVYSNRISRQSHIGRIHREVFHKCEMCEASYRNLDALVNHQSQKHMVELEEKMNVGK